MNELALFAGVGGGILGGLLSGFRTIAAVEKEPFPREVLLRRQRDGLLPLFPIWDDICTFNAREWRGLVDIVTAGFPCQPFSVAGKRGADSDSRNLWPETIRVIRDVGCEWAFLENVPGLLNPLRSKGEPDRPAYFGTVLRDLAESGFDVRWGVFSAKEAGAPHLRKRLWIVAHSRSLESLKRFDVDGQRGRATGAEQIRMGSCGPIPNAVRSGGGSGDEPTGREAGANADRGRPGAILAHPESLGSGSGLRSDEPGGDGRGLTGNGGCSIDAHALGERLEGIEQGWPAAGATDGPGNGSHSGWWESEPRLGRVAHGVAHRVDRLKAIGNGQVSAVAELAWRLLNKGFQ